MGMSVPSLLIESTDSMIIMQVYGEGVPDQAKCQHYCRYPLFRAVSKAGFHCTSYSKATTNLIIVSHPPPPAYQPHPLLWANLSTGKKLMRALVCSNGLWKWFVEMVYSCKCICWYQ